MQGFDNRRIDKLFDKYELTLEEIDFVKCSQTATTMDMNQSRIISEFVLAKTIEQSAYKMLNANEKLQNSNDDHNKKIRGLTLALIFVGSIQAIAIIMQILEVY